MIDVGFTVHPNHSRPATRCWRSHWFGTFSRFTFGSSTRRRRSSRARMCQLLKP
jgi:hypothetical protein